MHSYVIRISLVYTRMPSVCQQHVLVCHPYVTRLYLYVMICHSYALLCHPRVTRMYLYVIRMSTVCTRMSSVCHSYVLGYHPRVTLCTYLSFVCHSYVLAHICHPYVTRVYIYVSRMSLVCTRMSSLCNSYILSYVIRMSHVCTCMVSLCHSSVVLPWTNNFFGLDDFSHYRSLNFMSSYITETPTRYKMRVLIWNRLKSKQFFLSISTFLVKPLTYKSCHDSKMWNGTILKLVTQD